MAQRVGSIARACLALGMAAAGLALAIGGGELIAAGGSWYYFCAGLVLLAVACGLILRLGYSLPLYGALLVATLAWALWEVGLDGWALVPRLVAPAVLGAILLLPFAARAAGGRKWWVALPVTAIVVTLVVAAFSGGEPGAGLKPAVPLAAQRGADGDWTNWGRTLDGDRYSPLAAITTGNVGKLKLAWTFTSHVVAYGYHSFEATPLAADGKLYTCLDRNVIVALDPDSGREIWRFDAHPDLTGVFAATCRGIAWFEAPAGTQDCRKRLLVGVNDGRMMAIDVETGQPCRSFGTAGAVDLKAGLGRIEPGVTFPSSPPTIVNGVAMISGWVTDGLRTNEPSGVVRGYDALTGKQRWAWDSGRADPAAPLRPGETYTVGAPNAWGVFSGDPALGLVFFGSGVTTPDYYGPGRKPEAESYSTSLVALDVATGRPRWHFQTVHHDLWDYDVGAQPVLTTIRRGGQAIPALIGPTKRGQFFVLDRRSGTPIFPVSERPVPQDAASGDRAAPTQPYSSFANLAGGRLSERRMWGATPLDQLWCRIAFRRARYEGDFTPPGTRTAIFFPGSAGGSNWGSASVDPGRGLLIANTLYMPDIGRLIPRAEADRMAAAYGEGSKAAAFAFPQKGSAFAMDRKVFLGPLGVPCLQPPYGRLSAIDIASGKPVWSEPLGSARHAGPFGLSSWLPIRMGVPNLGGSIVTAGGLVFIGAAQDRRIRAFDVGDGREVWSHALPAIGAATPMTFRSPRSGRQYVVIAAGGHPGLPGPAGGSILAFALPR